MNRSNLLAWALAAALPASAFAKPSDLPRATPEEEGISSAQILGFVDAIDHEVHDMNSFMLVRHGHVVAEGWWAPYGPNDNHELYSLSKSFTSTAVGMAVAEGKLSVDDEVAKLFPEDAPATVAGNLAAMRVRDLLTMSTGHQDEPSAAADKVSPKSFLAQPVPHKPGTHFKYNTAATFMLSAAVQKKTGQTVLDYLRPRLFEPLGIENPVWNTNFQGVSLGGYGLRVRTEDIAKFGQLFLQKGKWNGRQLVPAAWVEAATGRQVSNGSNPASDWDQGYGFQFWRCRHGAYRGDGAFGQYCIVLPEQDAVIAITSGVKDMQGVLNLAWDKLLPGFQTKRLRADAAGQRALHERLAGLSVATPVGAADSPASARLIGKKIVFPANDQKLEWASIRAVDGGKGWVMTTSLGGMESSVPCGFTEWRKSRSRFEKYADESVAGSAAWVSDDTFVTRVCAYETPFNKTWRFKVDGNRVTLESEQNVGFGTTKPGVLVGTIE